MIEIYQVYISTYLKPHGDLVASFVSYDDAKYLAKQHGGGSDFDTYIKKVPLYNHLEDYSTHNLINLKKSACAKLTPEEINALIALGVGDAK